MSARDFQFEAADYANRVREAGGFDDGDAFDDLVAGERMAPPGRARGGMMLSSSMLLVTLCATGWFFSKNPEALDTVVAAGRAAFNAVRAPAGPASAPLPPSLAAEASAAAKQPLPEVVVAQAPGAAAGTPVESAAVAPSAVETPSAPVGSDTAPEGSVAAPAKLPPVTFDANDPLQKRAAAIGLDPDLSRSLLARLSADDFRNARHAIQTALAGKPSAGAVIWPKEPAPKLAQFEVRFVDGAPPECRRYVVIVSKDKWSTTARPMETCGAVKGAG